MIPGLLSQETLCAFPLHVFDRYEIHIQDFAEQITGIFIIFRCPSSQNLINIEIPEISKTNDISKINIDFQKIKKNDSHVYTQHIFQNVPGVFLNAF